MGGKPGEAGEEGPTEVAAAGVGCPIEVAAAGAGGTAEGVAEEACGLAETGTGLTPVGAAADVGAVVGVGLAWGDSRVSRTVGATSGFAVELAEAGAT